MALCRIRRLDHFAPHQLAVMGHNRVDLRDSEVRPLYSQIADMPSFTHLVAFPPNSLVSNGRLAGRTRIVDSQNSCGRVKTLVDRIPSAHALY